MSVIVKDTVDDEFKNCRSIYDINEYIYKLICKNKHLEFVENLESDMGIDVDLEMRNNTKEEISNLMLLIDMKRI